MNLFPTLSEIPDLQSFAFYRSFLDEPIFQDFYNLIEIIKQPDPAPFTKDALRHTYYHLKALILEESLKHDTERHYAPGPWQDLILRTAVSNENPLTSLFEKTDCPENHPFIKSMLHDFELLTALYHFDWDALIKANHLDDDSVFSAQIFCPLQAAHTLKETFDQGHAADAFKATHHYIYTNGLGIFEMNRCFKILENGDLVPVTRQHYKSMEDLIGYDREKRELIANTEALIDGHAGLNVLLQGDMGTGKSTMVKALLSHFKDTRLKMIEFKKDQLPCIPTVVAKIKHRPYPFILFIDDLSFEENDQDYKLFKNILEGSLEENPANVLIYATSNKRHLVTETRSERDNAIHTRDVMEEKLSLSSRFGLVLTFVSPDQKAYLNIVSALADSADIKLPTEELHAQARQWEMRHLNRSGRTAEQFIEYLKIREHQISKKTI